MYCPNCGEKIPDSSKFCPQCGGKIDLDEEPNKQAGNSAGTDQKSTPGFSQSGNNGNPKGNADGNPLRRLSNRTIGIIIAAAVVVVAIIVILIVILSGGTTINLNKYVDITVTGSEGYGRATAVIDTNAIIEDYAEKLKWKDEYIDGKDLAKLRYSVPVRLLVVDLDGSLDETSGLSNGDTITFIWDVDEEDINNCIENVKLNYSDFDYKVSGLQEAETYDAFAGVSVEFTGTSPKASATLSVAGSLLSESAYKLDKSENLAVGDTVTVTISDSAVESLLKNNGVAPEETSRTYTVEDVPYYARSVDEIPDDAMDRMKTEAEDAFHSQVARNWDADLRELKSIDFLGTYFLCRKDSVESGDFNKIYLIYKVYSTLYDKNEDETLTGHDLDYYVYVSFHNGIVTEDGTFSIDYSDYDYPWEKSGNEYIWFEATYHDYTKTDPDQTSNVAGALNLDDMFSYLVTTQIDNYTYENTVVDTQSQDEEQPETEEQQDTE